VRRREFITLLGGAAPWPLAARAQQAGRVVRIGFVGPAIDRPSLMFVPNYQAFLAQLHMLGFVEGQNLIVTYGAVDDPRGLAVVAAELMQVQPELIVVSGTEPMLQSVRAASQTVPIVLIAVNFDPIARGYVASLARPGGNITGVVFQQLELAQKQVELLTQAFPGKTHLAALFDAQSADQFSAAERSARSLKECLNAHWFMSLDDARRKCEAWRRDYNEERPHSAIGNKAPIELIDRVSGVC
jgi:putative ABC transport system substrate-binding protein